VDRGKVTAAAPLYLPEPVAAPSIEQLYSRLGMYWQALGVSDPQRVAQLSETTLQRAAAMPVMPNMDPMAQAIVAAGAVLDERLAQVLGVPEPSRALTAARAALLSGAVPDWPEALFGSVAETGPALDALRAALAEPTPEAVPHSMPTQRIESFSPLGPLRRIWLGKHQQDGGSSVAR